MMETYWERLSPAVKRGLTIAGIGTIMIATIMIFTPDGNDNGDRLGRQDTIRHILTDTNTREIGVDSLAANVKLLNARNEALRRDLDRLRSELENQRRRNDAASVPEAVERELQQLHAELADLKSSTRRAQAGEGQSMVPGESGELPSSAVPSNPLPSDADDYFANAPLPDLHAPYRDEAIGRRPADTFSSPLTIHLIEPEPLPVEDKPVSEPSPLYLPAGSLISGTLITGLDAPTHESARREPFPALLRIQKEAILPNRFRADIRECFLIAAGYGDLSSERAYLRGETLSCVRSDGGVIESRLDSYAVGEDGKAGVRGRLVSKQGQLVAKSMMAGFLQGLAGAFDVNPVPIIQTGNAGDTQLYQEVLSQQALQGAAIKGTGKALERVAQFYLDMAENIFPVIEVDAARQIEIVVTRGATLALHQGGKT